MSSIRVKIVVPFTVLFLAALVAVTLLAARATARSVDARIQGQMADIAQVLSEAAGALERPSVLAKLKTIVDGELATVDERGQVLASTLEPDVADALAQALADAPPKASEGAAPTRTLHLGETAYRATFVSAQGPRWRPTETFLYMLVPEAELRAERWRAVGPILIAAGCGAVAVVLIGYVVAHLIARPIEALARQMRGLAGQQAGQPPPLRPRKRNEVKELSEAFRGLLDSLRRAEAKLVGSERLAAVGQVAAGVAHEVRNPLSGIKMSAQLLNKKLADLGKPDDESVRVMLSEIARLEVIIDDLLTFSGPERLECEPGIVNDVVNEVLYFMHRQLDHASILVDNQLADDLPDVPLDAKRIRQVVLNLVLNATDAMPGGGTLTARTRATDDAVVTEIEDTGRGIPPENAERIFEPFFTTKTGGSGLGLGVSRLIVEAHGGELSFERTGIGARFVFTLPRRGSGGEQAEPPEAS